MKTIENANFNGKKVLVRVDFNVPVKDGKVTDDTRIRESLPTINKLLKDGAAIILMSHLGRPKGIDKTFTLRPVAEHLQQLLHRDVKFSEDFIGENTTVLAKDLNPGDVLLLENVRFHAGETKGDEELAKEISLLGDTYVNDAFGTAHREHASTATVARFFPGNKYFGLLLANELKNLENVIHNAQSPYTAIIGGAKVSSKIPVIKNLIGKVDNLIIGGGMAFTFIKAAGGKIGKSLVEDDMLDETKSIVDEIKKKGVELYIPSDAVVADAFSNDANSKVIPADQIEDPWMGLDIGPESIKKFEKVIQESKTILWNGPMGVFEMDQFQTGTKEIALAVAEATSKGTYSLAGGGDSVAAINKYLEPDQISYVSTGGGAMLEYMEGKELPGVKAILD
ncbi:phosphoglycerate kinase [Bacteroidota bacterium]